MMKVIKITLIALYFVSITGCVQKKPIEQPEIVVKDSVKDKKRHDKSELEALMARLDYIYWMGNSVKAHDERDTIWGNFTGKSIDTLFVERVAPYASPSESKDCGNIGHFYSVKSSNPLIPTVKLYTCLEIPPQLVFEGDLDRNGVDEWGVLETGIAGQWRQYFVYTLKQGRWWYLIDDDEFTWTNMYMRVSDKEVVEQGPEPGWVKVNYCDFFSSKGDLPMRDTVLQAKLTRIRR